MGADHIYIPAADLAPTFLRKERERERERETDRQTDRQMNFY